jgi:DNA-binding GntR family transcriptional regulator
LEKLSSSDKKDDQFLVDTAYQMIREAILSNEFKPGTILSENDLSRQIGISRTPTREALKRLGEQNLVNIIPRKGAFVTDLSVETIHEVYQVREALECFAIEFVPKYGDPIELNQIFDDVKRSDNWIKSGDIGKINDLDIHIHEYIAKSSHNQLLVKMVDQLLDQIVRLRRMTPNFPGRIEEQREEHLNMVKALKEGNVEEARERLRHHLRKVAETAIQIRLKMWQRS